MTGSVPNVNIALSSSSDVKIATAQNVFTEDLKIYRSTSETEAAVAEILNHGDKLILFIGGKMHIYNQGNDIAEGDDVMLDDVWNEDIYDTQNEGAGVALVPELVSILDSNRSFREQFLAVPFSASDEMKAMMQETMDLHSVVWTSAVTVFNIIHNHETIENSQKALNGLFKKQ